MSNTIFQSMIGALALVAVAGAAETTAFQRDREAILGMAGAYEVDFSFAEAVPVRADYELKKAYHEEARELVKVVKDEGKEIVLQHLLVVGP
ncbi:MAG: DUF6607 family protein, partial [Verrucomicrobiales bacterium]